jgi:type II secretory pathway pseudopilin PulG
MAGNALERRDLNMFQVGGRLRPGIREARVEQELDMAFQQLQQSIQRYIEQHNRKPKPYIWTAKNRDILEKVKRAWDALGARGGLPKVSRALASIERCFRRNRDQARITARTDRRNSGSG